MGERRRSGLSPVMNVNIIGVMMKKDRKSSAPIPQEKVMSKINRFRYFKKNSGLIYICPFGKGEEGIIYVIGSAADLRQIISEKYMFLVIQCS